MAVNRQTGLRQQPLLLLIVVLLFCGAMVARLVWMQLLEGPRFRELADENRIRLVPRSPTRGRLLDRKGRVLASSKLTYSLYLTPRLVTDADWPALRDRLADLLELFDYLPSQFPRLWGSPPRFTLEKLPFGEGLF